MPVTISPSKILRDGSSKAWIYRPNKTAEIRITLSEAGEYNFYCDKPFHSSFGMKGQIEVVHK